MTDKINRIEFEERIESLNTRLENVKRADSPHTRNIRLMEVGKELWDMAVRDWFYADTVHEIIHDISESLDGDGTENDFDSDAIERYVNRDGVAEIVEE